MASERLDLSGLPGVQAALARLTDFTKPLRTIALLLNAEARLCFVNQAAPDGTPWAKFKRPPSVKRGGPSAKLLRDKDLLMGSLTGQGAEHVENVTASRLEWGSNVPWSPFQQDGTRFIPARPFVGLTPGIRAKIARILEDYAAKVGG